MKRLLAITLFLTGLLFAGNSQQSRDALPEIGSDVNPAWIPTNGNELCQTHSTQRDPCFDQTIEGTKFKIAYNSGSKKISYISTTDEKFRTAADWGVGTEMDVSANTILAFPGWFVFAPPSNDGWWPIIGFNSQVKLKGGSLLKMPGKNNDSDGDTASIQGFARGHYLSWNRQSSIAWDYTQPDPLVGKWKLNVAKSASPPASGTISIQRDGTQYRISFDFAGRDGTTWSYRTATDMKGKPSVVTWIKPNGRESHEEGWVTRRAAGILVIDSGLNTKQYTLSSDGKTLTEEFIAVKNIPVTVRVVSTTTSFGVARLSPDGKASIDEANPSHFIPLPGPEQPMTKPKTTKVTRDVLVYDKASE